MNSSGKLKTAVGLLVGAGICAVALPVMAQEPEDGDSSGNEGLDRIVVSAQRREQDLQEVPISVTAVQSEELDVRRISSLEGLNSLAPNLVVQPAPGNRAISTVGIRGSVASQPAIWMDPPVGLYLNGVFLGKSQGSVFEVVDIERVEVLRGPQGTLFGRNTEGGAINFITRRPSGEWRGSAGVEVGNYGRKVGRVMMDLPTLGVANISLAARKEKVDGWAKNLSGPDMGAIDTEAYRTAVDFTVSDALQIAYEFDYSRSDNTPVPTSLFRLEGWSTNFPAAFGPFLGGAIENAIAPFLVTSRPSTVSVNAPDILETSKHISHALTFDYEINESQQLRYIFAHRKMNFADAQSISGTPLDFIEPAPGSIWGLRADYTRETSYEQDSHELQWLGEIGGFNWVVGLYRFSDEGETNGAQNFNLFGAPFQRADYAAFTKADAIYGQVDYQFADRWVATAGLRVTEERRDGWSHRYVTDGYNGPAAGDILPFIEYGEKFSATTPVGALTFLVNDDLSVYARVATGFKSGGFSQEIPTPDVTTPFQPQESLSTELGFKSTLFDRRMTFNATLFHNRIKNLHTTQLIPGTTNSLLTNAGEAVFKGLEVETMFRLSDGWQIRGNWGYLDAKFTKYLDNSFAPGRPLIDTASNRIPGFAPKHTLSLFLDGLLWRTSRGDLRAIFDYSYTSSMYLYAVNRDLAAPNAGGQYVADINGIPAFKNLNARLALSGIPMGNGSADLSFFIKNLTNQASFRSGIDFSLFHTANWQEPRMYMLTATYNW